MPNRILKESICASDTIDELSWFEEVLFYRLIVNCDDYGRFDGRPSIIKNRLFPLKENLTIKAVSTAINSLANAGLVVLYEFEGKPFLYLPTWESHQSIRAKKSKYPDPDNITKSSEIICNQMQANVTVIQSNTKSESNTNTNPVAHTRGEFGWVKMTDEQYEKLVKDFGKAEADRSIAYVDESAQQTGNKNKWKDWYLTVRKCCREKWGVKSTSSYEPTYHAPQPYAPPDASKREKGPTFLPDWAD